MAPSPQTACLTHIHQAQNEQQQGVHGGRQHVQVPSFLEERGADGMGGVSLPGAPIRVLL